MKKKRAVRAWKVFFKKLKKKRMLRHPQSPGYETGKQTPWPRPRLELKSAPLDRIGEVDETCSYGGYYRRKTPPCPSISAGKGKCGYIFRYGPATYSRC